MFKPNLTFILVVDLKFIQAFIDIINLHLCVN